MGDPRAAPQPGASFQSDRPKVKAANEGAEPLLHRLIQATDRVSNFAGELAHRTDVAADALLGVDPKSDPDVADPAAKVADTDEPCVTEAMGENIDRMGHQLDHLERSLKRLERALGL